MFLTDILNSLLLFARFPKAALRDYQQCKCGNVTGEETDLSVCDRTCRGDEVSKCGNNWEHSVYDTGSITLPSYLENPTGIQATAIL